MRTLDFFILRTCERLSIRPAEFEAAPYERQVQWLAYDLVREADEQSARQA